MMLRPEKRAASGAAPRPGYGVVRSIPFDGDDEALVAGMRAGRSDAAAAFYDRYARGVHGFVFRLMGPDGEVDDVVHDVFVRALESLPRLRQPSALRSWLFGIAVRCARIRLQRRTRQRWLRFMAPEDVPEVPTMPATELGEALGHVYAILRGMRPEERIAFVLHRVEGMTLEDAARTAGTSLATIRRRLARAEAKFFARARVQPALESWLDPSDEGKARP
jgi:RNA polymerase sigma-70 factor (ECF subfamily)